MCQIALDASATVDAVISAAERLMHARLNRSNFTEQEQNGGLFRSSMSGGQTIAMYFHPTRKHSATADGGFMGGGMVRAIAGPGKWAVAYSSTGWFGANTHWNDRA